MSFRLAASAVRDRAEAARARASGTGVDKGRLARLKEYLQAGDVQALNVWLQVKVAQALDEAANDLQARAREASEDVTVSARGPKRQG